MLRWAYKPKFIVSNNECFFYQSRPRIEHLAITSKMMVVIFHVGSNKIVTHQESYVSIAWILQYTDSQINEEANLNYHLRQVEKIGKRRERTWSGEEKAD